MGFGKVCILGDKVEEFTAGEVLHDKVDSLAPNEDVDSCDDVGMIDGKNDLHLPSEKLCFILPTQSGNHLDGDILVGEQVLGDAHLTVHALANKSADAVKVVHAGGNDGGTSQGDDPDLEGALGGGYEGEGAMGEGEFYFTRIDAFLNDGIGDGNLPRRGSMFGAMGG